MAPRRMLSFIVVGNAHVGKTALITRFSGEEVLPAYLATILIDFKTRELEIDGERVKITIWDTAGQERFGSIISSYYRRAQGIVVVYDITDRASFAQISQRWEEVLRDNTDGGVARVLVGNKTDLDVAGGGARRVSYEEGRRLAARLGARFYETSAYENANVDAAFINLAVAVKQRLDAVADAQETIGGAARIEAPPPAAEKRCCVLS